MPEEDKPKANKFGRCIEEVNNAVRAAYSLRRSLKSMEEFVAKMEAYEFSESCSRTIKSLKAKERNWLFHFSEKNIGEKLSASKSALELAAAEKTFCTALCGLVSFLRPVGANGAPYKIVEADNRLFIKPYKDSSKHEISLASYAKKGLAPKEQPSDAAQDKAEPAQKRISFKLAPEQSTASKNYSVHGLSVPEEGRIEVTIEELESDVGRCSTCTYTLLVFLVGLVVGVSLFSTFLMLLYFDKNGIGIDYIKEIFFARS
ncbi:uncharacterized protein NEMAJ01_0549 [Nematocida major]|uniref:uncharacterized protein n=1 Tax=Nematocida major TaxID=1912982 RepID=UPI00200781E2|nr:uncharacterized protein NEMAJ01_0549 [Nematocida major]KAH9385653.1 hypothetical protein NEMAJ01_0549 [Nematocida major]